MDKQELQKEIEKARAHLAKTQGTIYCLDENFLSIAKSEIGEERLKKYLKGEQWQ